MWLLIPALLAVNPAFRDKQVIPAFHRENPRIEYFQTLFRRSVSQTEDILVVLGGSPDVKWQRDPKYSFWVPGDRLGIFKAAKGDRTRAEQIAMVTGDNKNCAVKIERADNRSLTLYCTGDYGIRHNFLKVFYDFRAGRMLKVEKFTPARVHNFRASEAILFAGEDRLRINLTRANPVLSSNVVHGQEEVLRPPGCEVKPPRPLPQSTQKELTAVRPQEKGGEILEEIGACRMVGQTLWFGVHFWDGEGMTGVGRIGQFDFKTGKYRFLRPPGLRNFATSSLLVEPDAIWVGLVHHPEGAADARGLLRWNPKSGEEIRYPVSPNTVHLRI